VTLPIWLTLSNKALQAFFSIPVWMRVGLVTNKSSPTICTGSPTALVRLRHARQERRREREREKGVSGSLANAQASERASERPT